MVFIHIRFPCGLEIEIKSIWNSLNEDDLIKFYDSGCPIHRHNCIGKRK